MTAPVTPPMSGNPLSSTERKRRVLLVALAFARNMAFYRAGWENREYSGPKDQFWIAANGNFIDVATLDWWKLFGDKRGKHSWRKVVSDVARFERDLLANLGITAAEFDAVMKEASRYRDKFLAHLDDEREFVPPKLDKMWTAVQFLFRYVMAVEMTPEEAEDVRDDLARSGLPSDIADFQKERFEEARREYRRRQAVS